MIKHKIPEPGRRQSVTDGTTYTTTIFKALGNTYSVMEVVGKYNYVNVSKLTNNPFLTIGKDYENWDVAISSYKSPDLKVALLRAKLGV